MADLFVPIESVLTAEISDKHILTCLILSLSIISKTLSIAARYAVEYARFISPAYQKAISGKCVSQFTTARIFAATKQGKSNDSVKQFLVLMDEKKAFYVTCMKSNPYHLILMDGRLGLFSILRVVTDRCRTRPELAVSPC